MRVALVAGEASGDLLGAGLIDALRSAMPEARFEGVAGPEMARAGCDVLAPAEALAVMGLIEPLRELPGLLRLRRRLIERWSRDRPDVFVGIDAPDFNLGLEARLSALCIRTVHYVSPSVWAWRQGRVHRMATAVDRVLCLLPFEKAFYDRHGIAADFVGHPMADRTPAQPDTAGARAALGLPAGPLLAVLPGSRRSEVTRLGPLFVAACGRLLAARPGLRFAAPMATAAIGELFGAAVRDAGLAERFLLTAGRADDVIAAADVVLLASGTASLQAALIGRPMVAAYRLAPLTYAIARAFRLVKVPYITLPNLLTEVPLVPEFIQGAASAEALAAAVGALFDDPRRRERIAASFGVLRETLARDADRRAAAAVLDVVRGSAGGVARG